MTHTHRVEIRITVPRRAPVKIELDAQDVAFPEIEHPLRAGRQPGKGSLAKPA